MHTPPLRTPCLVPALLLALLVAAPLAAQDLSGIGDFWYRLQGLGGNDLDVAELAAGDHELLIIDASRNGLAEGEFTSAEIETIRSTGDNDTLVLAYVSIGEASDFRWYWDELTTNWPHVLGPVNPDFPESRKVRYWSPDWKQFIIGDAVPGGLGDSYVKRVVDAGFDGVYLDIIDAFETFGPWGNDEKVDAASEMITFVEEIAAYARDDLGASDFLVVPQNGAGIIDIDQFQWAADPEATRAAELARYVGVIDALGLEDVFHLGKLDENNKPRQDRFRNEHLAMFLAAGVPMFATEYLSAFRPNPKKLSFPQVVLDLQARAAGFGDDNGVPGAGFPIITQSRALDRAPFDPQAVPGARYETVLAVGQSSTNATRKGKGADGLKQPSAALVADGALLVADTGNHRVLRFDAIPDTPGTGADHVLGQADFADNKKTKGGLSGLNAPQGLAWNGDQLFVADTGNHRVLVWDGIPEVDDAPLDFLLGQSDPAGARPSSGGIGMNAPTGLFATADMLWVCDTQNNRVQRFSLPIELTVAPDVVLGQVAPDGKRSGSDADQLDSPMGVASSPSGRLAVADSGNNRVLIWDQQPDEHGAPADRVLGQDDFGERGSGVSDVALRTPTGVLWLDDETLLVTDSKNNRLCLWSSDLPGAPMDDVIGQSSLFSKKKGKGALGLAEPLRAASTGDGRLLVVDSKHNRVLVLEAAED